MDGLLGYLAVGFISCLTVDVIRWARAKLGERASESKERDTMKLYCLAIAGDLPGDKTHAFFSDTAAVCCAKSEDDALARFRKLYQCAQKENVEIVGFNDYGIAILTSY